MAPMAAILAQTSETVLAVTGIRAYPAGFGFTLKLRLRNLAPRERRGFWPFPEFGHHRGRAWPAEALRLSVEFADGRSATNIEPATVGTDGPDPDRLMLSDGPGTGLVASGSSPDRWGWDMEYRVRPCPRRDRWPSSAPGRDAGSPPRGSRSTARRSSRRPTPR
jgi:hypothetical protein